MGAADRTDAEVDELMDVSAKKRAEVDALWAKLNGGGGSSDASAAASKAPAKGGRGRGAKKAAATTTDDDSHSGPGPSKGRAALDVIARLNRVAGGAVAGSMFCCPALGCDWGVCEECWGAASAAPLPVAAAAGFPPLQAMGLSNNATQAEAG